MERPNRLPTATLFSLSNSGEPAVPIGIQILPVEIMGEIFLQCLEGDEYVLPSCWTLMIICRVSSYWRQVALSLPVLWSSISGYTDGSPKGYQLQMEAWLSRSRGYPLTLELRRPMKKEQTHNTIFPLFISHINHWYDIRLCLNGNTYEQFLSVSPGGKLVLYKLQLYLDETCTAEQTSRLSAVLGQFPSLRRLTLDSNHERSILDLPWSKLTHICLLLSVSADHCVTILAQCPNVVDCTMLSVSYPTGPFTRNNVSLPHLNSLCLASGCQVIDVLDHLTCPAISMLELDHQGPNCVQNIDDFLVRSSCNLDTFSFASYQAPQNEMLGYISIPSLKSIRHLYMSELGDNAVGALIFPTNGDGNGGSRILLPFLETIDLDTCRAMEDIVVDMARSRFMPPGPSGQLLSTLKTLQVEFSFSISYGIKRPGLDPVPHNTVFKKCEQLRNNGFDIQTRISDC